MSWTETKVRQARQLQRKGLTMTEIAERLDVPRNDVVLYLFGGIRPQVECVDAPRSAEPAPPEMPNGHIDQGKTSLSAAAAKVLPANADRPDAPVASPTPRGVRPRRSVAAKRVRSKPPAMTAADPLVAEFVARNGVRRFEAGASGDPMNLRLFLVGRGYEVEVGKFCRTFRVKAPGKGQRKKELDLAAFIALCDEVRRDEGLQPLRAS